MDMPEKVRRVRAAMGMHELLASRGVGTVGVGRERRFVMAQSLPSQIKISSVFGL
jgi:hypothetical protein